MRSFAIILLTLMYSVISYASDQHPAYNKQNIANFIKQQTKTSNNVSTSISSIVSRYPEKVDIIIPIALTLYPDEYEQIMISAIGVESALACDVVSAAIESNVVSVEDAVRIAVEVDPAYALEIIETAAHNDINEIENIIRVTVVNESLDKQSFIKKAFTAFPEQFNGILSAAIGALPNQVVDFVSSALELFPNQADEVVTTAVSSNTTIANRHIVNKAIEKGINYQVAIDAALTGGATETELAQLHKDPQ